MGKNKPKAAKKKDGGLQLIGYVAGGLVALVLLGVGVSAFPSLSSSPPPAAAKASASASLYDLTATKMDGEALPISSFAGKAVLMVNVASR